MLRRLYVDNYKCLVNFDLRLQELSLLLGPNGVGKTAVLDIMFALRRLLDGSAKITDGDAFSERTLTRWQAGRVQVFEVEVALATDGFIYRLEVDHDWRAKQARVLLERLVQKDDAGEGCLFEFANGEVQLHRDDYSVGPRYTSDWTESALARIAPRRDNQRLSRFLDFMRKTMVCSLYPPVFSAESRRENPVLERDTRNFADWYRHMIQERPDLLPKFTSTLQEIIHGFSGIRLEKVGREARALIAVFDEEDVRYELRFDELSDGQRALIALYGMVHLTANQGYTLFFDEPDNYVALAEIQPWLREIENACGETIPQAVISSHHPELIDHLGNESSYALRREASGMVTARQCEPVVNQPGLKRSELIARGWDV